MCSILLNRTRSQDKLGLKNSRRLLKHTRWYSRPNTFACKLLWISNKCGLDQCGDVLGSNWWQDEEKIRLRDKKPIWICELWWGFCGSIRADWWKDYMGYSTSLWLHLSYCRDSVPKKSRESTPFSLLMMLQTRLVYCTCSLLQAADFALFIANTKINLIFLNAVWT